MSSPTAERPHDPGNLVKVGLWLTEHGLFAIALFALIPGVNSEGPGLVMPRAKVWIASVAFALHALAVRLRKGSTLATSALKTVVFFAFAYVLHAVLTTSNVVTP